MADNGIDDGLEHLRHGRAENESARDSSCCVQEVTFPVLDGYGMGMDRYGFDADALQRTASTHSYRQSGSGQPQLELLKSSSCIGLLPSSAARRIQTRSCALNGASAARCNQTEIPYMLKHPTHKAAATSRSCVLHRQRPTRKHVLNDLHFI